MYPTLHVDVMLAWVNVQGRGAHLDREVCLDGCLVVIVQRLIDVAAAQELPGPSAEAAHVVRGALRLWVESHNWSHETGGAPAQPTNTL